GPAVLAELANHNAGTEPPPPSSKREPAKYGVDQGALSRAVRTGDGHPLTPSDLDVYGAKAETSSPHDGVFELGYNHPRSGRLVDGEAKLPSFPGLFHRLETLQTFERL